MKGSTVEQIPEREINQGYMSDDVERGIGFYLIPEGNDEDVVLVYVIKDSESKEWLIGVEDPADTLHYVVSEEEAKTFFSLIEPFLKKAKSILVVDGKTTDLPISELFKVTKINESKFRRKSEKSHEQLLAESCARFMNEGAAAPENEILLKVANEIGLMDHDIYPENYYFEKTAGDDLVFMHEDGGSRQESRKFNQLLQKFGYVSSVYRQANDGEEYGISFEPERT